MFFGFIWMFVMNLRQLFFKPSLKGLGKIERVLNSAAEGQGVLLTFGEQIFLGT